MITKKLYIFDKDGTLCRSKSGQTFINSVGDQELIPGVAGKIAELKTGGAKIAIASNQGGVAFGHMTYSDADVIMLHAANLVRADEYIFCPYHPSGINIWKMDSPDRKPNPGMILYLVDRWQVALEDTIYIGDRPEDEQAAKNAGVEFMWAKDFFGWEG